MKRAIHYWIINIEQLNKGLFIELRLENMKLDLGE